MTRIIIGCFFRPFEAFVGHCPKFVGSSHRAVGRQLSLSGNSFNPCSQGTHDIGDASPGARFITSEILGRHRVVAFRSSKAPARSSAGNAAMISIIRGIAANASCRKLSSCGLHNVLIVVTRMGYAASKLARDS